jgi:Cu/Ag efflux pump CusA
MGNVFHDGLVEGVVVWSKPSARNDVTQIADISLDTPTNGSVRVGDIAKVAMASDPYLVKRDKGLRYLDVTANVEGRDLGSVVRDIQTQLGTVSFPEGTHYELLGEYAERQAVQSRLLWTALLAVVLVLFLLRFAFDSWRRALLLFLTAPMAIVGGLVAIWLSGGVVSIGALVGLFTVFGLAQGNGILLVNHCDHLEWDEGMAFGPEMVLRGARERLAPILMTSLCIGLGLLPLLLAGDAPGHEIEYPLAVAIIGGLFTSTLFTLFVLPTFYLRFGRSKSEMAVEGDASAADELVAE